MDHALARSPLRSAQWAITAVFCLHGLLLAAWAPHIASIKDSIGISDAVLGWVLLCMAGGALTSMQIVGRLIDRYGSKPVTIITTLLYCGLVNGPLHAGSVTELALALFVFGGSAGAMDVAMNAHGAVIEARRGKPCMSSMHGAFSVGALVGAGLGAVMLSAGYAPWEHTLTSSLIAVAVGCICFLFLLPAKVDRGSGPRRRARLSRTILILGMLGAIAMMAEGAMVDWSAVYMRDVVGAAIAQEGWAFAGFSAAMAVVRVGGDRLSVWFGRQVLMWISTGIAMAGCFLMAALPGLWTGVLGATLVGIGVANCVPLVFAAAARVGGTGAAGGGLAMVAGLSYCGFLLGPPIVGGLSELFSLRISLAVIGALLLVVAVVRLPGADSDRPRG